MKNKSNYIIGAALLVIFGLIAYIIFSSPVKIVEKFDEAPLREEIRLKDSLAGHWEQEAEAWSHIARTAEDKVDSLEQLKPQIYENHSNQINFNATATDQQLDSVIRANW
jgi:hypothetical protein